MVFAQKVLYVGILFKDIAVAFLVAGKEAVKRDNHG